MSVPVLPVPSRALVAACERLGLDGDALLNRAGLSRSAIAGGERIDSDLADQLWMEALSMSADSAIALRAAESLQPGDYPVLYYTVAHSPTLGDGLERVARYFDVVDPRVQLTWTERRLTMTLPGLPGPIPRPPAEYTLTAIWLLTRWASGLDWTPTSVSFPFSRPSDAHEHRRVFNAPVHYDSPHPAIEVSSAWWNREPENADPALGMLLDAHAGQLASQAPRDNGLEVTIRRAVAAILPGREPTAERVAKHLGLSERTLHRRLKAEDLKFGEILDRLRLDQSRAHLAVPDIGIAEVSWLLGFSDPSAFGRAFKRWTGQTPGDWRAAATSQPGQTGGVSQR